MKKKLLFILLILCILIGGFIYISHDAKMFIYLTDEQKVEDYEYLWQIVNDSYPFLGVIQRAGIDVDEIYNKYKSEIKNCNSDIEYLKLLSYCINELGGYGHIGILDTNTYMEHKRIFTQDIKKLNEKDIIKYKPWIETITNPISEAAYNLLDETIENGFRTKKYLKPTKDDNSEILSAKENISTKILEQNKIAYIKINSFKIECYENDKKAIFDFYDKISGCSNLIIDIRENRGGSDLYWQDLIVKPNIDSVYTSENFYLFKYSSQTKSYINSCFVEDEILSIEKLPRLENINEQDLKDMDYYINNRYTISPINSEKTFKGKIWVLTSPKIYSSSENFVMFCKDTGFATLVGTRTGGDGGAVDPIYTALPNTGLILRFSMLYGLNKDGTCNEEFGTTPDIETQSSELALEVCLKNIH